MRDKEKGKMVLIKFLLISLLGITCSFLMPVSISIASIDIADTMIGCDKTNFLSLAFHKSCYFALHYSSLTGISASNRKKDRIA